MLRAYSGMPFDEFIAQLRTYVIALGLSPCVVDCVDELCGVGEPEASHADELSKAEEEAEKRGRESMKAEIINEITSWLENQSGYEQIKEPCEAILTLLEKVKA